MLTPLDIHNKEFKRSFRGYNEDEIDEFLDAVVKDYEILYRENIDLKENIERLKSKVENFERLENTLHNTLVVAQETAEEVKNNANKEAELIREDAKATSKRVVEDAKTTGQRMVAEATDVVMQKKLEYQTIEQNMQLYCSKMKNILQTQLDQIKDIESTNKAYEEANNVQRETAAAPAKEVMEDAPVENTVKEQ